MDLNDWIKEVKLEEIPEEYRPWAEAIGVEAILRQAKFLGGNTRYFPKIDALTHATRDRLIIQDYRAGVKMTDLTAKYDISDSWVRRLIDRYITKRDQLGLFDKAI
jgi:Mor family transcriptional regulator